MSTLGEKIKELRERLGLSQRELAARLNLGSGTIANYETGNRSPDYQTLQRLADLFSVSTDYLLGRTDDPTPPGAKPKPAQHTNEEFRAFLRGRRLSERDIELILQLEERMRRENEEKKKGQE
ncbi:MAG: helix-turn-helix domain-containing protein [Bacillota bacterium]